MSLPTSLSLLDRIQNASDSPDWRIFLEVYEPLLRGWLRRHAVLPEDSNDVVQNVLSVVIRKIKDFEHNGREGAFRTWLRTITFHCLHEHWRERKGAPKAIGGSDAQTRLAELEDPDSELSRAWDIEHDRYVMRQLLDYLAKEFEEKTWLAFKRFAMDGVPAADVAQELEMTTNAVFVAKSRVLARLRQESKGLLDS